MASLKEIRSRIASVRSTRKITSAMKVVAASKYHRAAGEYAAFQVYASRYQDILAITLRELERLELATTSPLLQAPNPHAPVQYLLLSSNDSLCGVFNTNVVKHYDEVLSQRQAQGLTSSPVDLFASDWTFSDSSAEDLVPEGEKGTRLWVFGKKAHELLERNGTTVDHADPTLVGRVDLERVGDLFDRLKEDYLAGRTSAVRVIYNRFVNAAVQKPSVIDLLPMRVEMKVSVPETIEYILEPTPHDLLYTLLPYIARLRLSDCFLQNYVGEFGARMTSMTQATDNADDLIDDLTLDYNKARQAAITNELVEIVSGANALH